MKRYTVTGERRKDYNVHYGSRDSLHASSGYLGVIFEFVPTMSEGRRVYHRASNVGDVL